MAKAWRELRLRIDRSLFSPPLLPRSRAWAAAAKPGRLPSDLARPTADAAADLSTGSDVVDRLKAQLDAIPDIRQQRVEVLRQAIRDGNFTLSPRRIAEAMLL